MGYASSNLALSTIFWQCSIAANAAPSYGEDRVFESHHCYHLNTRITKTAESFCIAGVSKERRRKGDVFFVAVAE